MLFEVCNCKAAGGYLPWRDDVPFETTCRKLSVPLKVGMATGAGLFSTQVLTGEQSLPYFEIKRQPVSSTTV